MLTCLCDAFYGEVGIATVRALEHTGCEVVFDERQTCCGQPPFNAGDWKSARSMAARCLEVFSGDCPLVVPSASCAAMMHEGYAMLEVSTPPPTYELAQFLLEVRQVAEWPSLGSPVRAAFHKSCHGRMLGLGDSQIKLMQLVGGLELVPFEQEDQCCGFGGAFSVTHGATSSGIGGEKLDNVVSTEVDVILSGDMGCLMHLQGLADKTGCTVTTKHYVEILAEAL